MIQATNRELSQRDPAFPLLPAAGQGVEFREGYVGDGYAHATPEARAAAELALELQGFKLDTTYSAKALACLVDDARAGRLRDCVPVFWQTYNSRPCPPGLERVDTSGLPESLKPYLDS
jgi:1-aminocyclopropane-1-carboxylate deaminase/D-cysteine desulfhydrase-like pyridoxal-dependent ACC family enzyme